MFNNSLQFREHNLYNRDSLPIFYWFSFFYKIIKGVKLHEKKINILLIYKQKYIIQLLKIVLYSRNMEYPFFKLLNSWKRNLGLLINYIICCLFFSTSCHKYTWYLILVGGRKGYQILNPRFLGFRLRNLPLDMSNQMYNSLSIVSTKQIIYIVVHYINRQYHYTNMYM